MLSLAQIKEILMYAGMVDDSLLQMRTDAWSVKEYCSQTGNSLARIIEFPHFITAKKFHMMLTVSLLKQYHLMPETWQPAFFKMDKSTIEKEEEYDYLFVTKDTQYDIMRAVLNKCGFTLHTFALYGRVRNAVEKVGISEDLDTGYLDGEEERILKDNRNAIVDDVLSDMEKTVGKQALELYREMIASWIDSILDQIIIFDDILIISHPRLKRLDERIKQYDSVLPKEVTELYHMLLDNMELLYFVQYGGYESGMKNPNAYCTIWNTGHVMETEEIVSHVQICCKGLLAYPLMECLIEYLEQRYPVLFKEGGDAVEKAVS